MKYKKQKIHYGLYLINFWDDTNSYWYRVEKITPEKSNGLWWLMAVPGPREEAKHISTHNTMREAIEAAKKEN